MRTDEPRVRPVAMVTGGSSGIGLEFSRQLAKAGCDLILVSKDLDRLQQAKAMLSSECDVRIDVRQCDLAVADEVADLSRFVSALRRIDFLVNNAGSTFLGKFQEVERQNHLAILQLHVMATTMLAHAAVEVMRRQHSGTIINVSSFTALLDALPTETLYGPTKAYMVAFSRTLARSLKGTGITVQALCPGYTLTDFHRTEEFTSKGVDVYKKIPAVFWMTPEEVVETSLRSNGELVVIPGFKNRLFVSLLNFWPMRLLLKYLSR